MQKIIEVGDIQILITKRRNSRQFRLYIHPKKGVCLSIPLFSTYSQAERFACENYDWIKTNVEKLQNRKQAQLILAESPFSCRNTITNFDCDEKYEGIRISTKGTVVTIRYNQQADLDSEEVQTVIRKAVTIALKNDAKVLLSERIKFLSEKTDLRFSEFSIGSASSRWGCCSSRNKITLSCFLLLVPDELIDFVILHELCHIAHKNHGQEFHRLLNELCNGKENELNKELKKYSCSLFKKV